MPWRFRIGGVTEPRPLRGTVLLAGTCQGPHRTLLQRLPGTVQHRIQSGLLLLALSVPTCRGCCIKLFSMRDTLPLAEEERENVLTAKSTVIQERDAHTENEATRLSAEKATVEAAASVTAALDRWQAAKMPRRRVVEASKKSAEALRMAHRVSDEVLDHLLKSVEDFDKQVHSITMREDSLMLGADEWFRDFRQAVERTVAWVAQCLADEEFPGRDASSRVSFPSDAAHQKLA